jgi:hypothetical protein
VGFPAVMKLLGHSSPDMTMKYLDIALPDLQREFHLARSHPRHLAPQPKAVVASARSGLNGVLDSLLASQHVLEIFRRALHTARHAILWTASPTGFPKSFRRSGNSTHSKNRQRLAG